MHQKIENNLIYLLHQIKEVLDKYNIEFWLDCGTLLGAVRDGKFIPWEHDLDFGVFYKKNIKNFRFSIAKAFSDKGFKIFVSDNYITIKGNKDTWADINFYNLCNEKAIVSFKKPKNLIGLLLYIFYKVLLSPYYYKINFKMNRTIIITSTFVITSRILPSFLRKLIAKKLLIIYKKIGSKDILWVVPNYFFTKLATIIFYEKEFKIPYKAEEYLAYRYGKDWNVPKKNWVTEKDDHTVVI